MRLEPKDQQHLLAADGYVALGMYEEANEELESITADVRHVPEVLDARIAIYCGTKRWDAMAAVASRLVEWNPDEPRWFVQLAYATRRAESLEKAHKILSRCAELHPEHGWTQFNLACYEAQLRNLPKAREHLQRAIRSDPGYRLDALNDPDLEPLWHELKAAEAN
jgi:tetratricopeptide (TPR) repeat protein